jgi:hypothetical protein
VPRPSAGLSVAASDPLAVQSRDEAAARPRLEACAAVMDEASLRRRPARGRKHRVSAAPRSWLSRGRLLLVLRPKPRRFCWPWLARSITGRRRSYIRPCRSASVIAKSATDSQLIVALDHRSLRVPGMSDGARNVDCPRLSGKAPAGDFKRGLTSPTPPAISARRAGRAFPLPSRSSVQRLPCATIFPSAETAHPTSVPMRFMRTPIAYRCIGQRRPNRPAPVANRALGRRLG